MPMSQDATDGLRAAVEYNPAAARYLMDILRSLPLGVRYKKQDRYGPLAMMISAFPQTMQITRSVSLPVKNPRPFPQEKLELCETFNKEWLQQDFTKQELADAIEQILAEIRPVVPLVDKVDETTTLIFTREGAFLSDDLYERDLKRKIDPE